MCHGLGHGPSTEAESRRLDLAWNRRAVSALKYLLISTKLNIRAQGLHRFHHPLILLKNNSQCLCRLYMYVLLPRLDLVYLEDADPFTRERNTSLHHDSSRARNIHLRRLCRSTAAPHKRPFPTPSPTKINSQTDRYFWPS